MGKIMINGESYPSYVVKTGVDDTGIFEDKAWSSKKTSDEIAEVETALPNIKKFANPGGTAKYITISGATLGDIEVHSAYAGKYMFTSTGTQPIFFGTSTYLGYTLTGWAWNSDKTKLYLRVNGQRDFVISAFGSDGVEISDMTTTAPTDVTFDTTFNYNAYIDNSTSENTSTYSSAKIDTELNKKLHTYSKQWYGSHDRYVKLGSVPISTGSVSVGSLLVTLFASSTKLEGYPVGTISLNISSGASVNAFNINGFSTIALNTPRADNFYTPRIVVDKTSTHYVLYIDCSYNYLKITCSILNSTNFAFGDFETASALEGTEAWSSVTSDDIKYVGDMAKLDDSSTGDTYSTWSSSKIASEIGRTQIPHVGTTTGWKAEKDLSSLPVGTYRLTSMHSSSGSVIDALILKTGYSYFLKTVLKEGANITVGISGDTLTVAESTTSIGVISVFLNTVGINA